MTDILLKHPEVAQVFGSIGTPSTGRAGQGGAAGEVNKASLYVMLKPKAERKLSQQQFEDLVRPELVQSARCARYFFSHDGSRRQSTDYFGGQR
jgi:HAE1 family hydrophobic/amphiphilic exporter-1